MATSSFPDGARSTLALTVTVLTELLAVPSTACVFEVIAKERMGSASVEWPLCAQ